MVDIRVMTLIESRIENALGVCCCGSPYIAFSRLIEILEKCDSEDSYWAEIDGSTHIALWFLHSKGMTDHGISILRSWLTDDGKELLKSLREWEQA